MSDERQGMDTRDLVQPFLQLLSLTCAAYPSYVTTNKTFPFTSPIFAYGDRRPITSFCVFNYAHHMPNPSPLNFEINFESLYLHY